MEHGVSGIFFLVSVDGLSRILRLRLPTSYKPTHLAAAPAPRLKAMY